MGRLVAIVLAAAAVMIALVAVGGAGKDKPSEQAGTPARSSPAVVPTGAAGEVASGHAPIGATVVMRNLAFRTPVVTVRRGQAVRFVNHDDVAHTVLQDYGARGGQQPLFESGRILPGGSFVWVAPAPGTYRYVCSLHPTVMHGRIVVTAST
jgi:plastocyanin